MAASGATDVLLRIADTEPGVPLADDLMSDIRLAEASLRDHLSAPIFSHPLFSEEVKATRTKGVSVRLSGESLGSNIPLVIGGALARKLRMTLQSTRPGDAIVIRHLPDSTPPEYTAVTVRGDHVERQKFDEFGQLLSSV